VGDELVELLEREVRLAPDVADSLQTLPSSKQASLLPEYS